MSEHGSKEDKLGKLLKGLPQETPGKDFDEKFWKRFELEKDLPLPAGKPALRPIPVLAAALVALVLFSYAAGRADRPLIRISEGVSQSSAPVGHTLKTGGLIQTGSSGWAIIELENAYRIKIHPDSELRVDQIKRSFLPGKTVFYLSKGETLVSIGSELRKNYPLEIRTPVAFAKAMGTQFLVATPSGPGGLPSKIAVLKGVVEVGSMRNGKPVWQSSINVSGGHQTLVAEGQSPDQPQALVESEHRVLEELFQFGRKNRFLLLAPMGAGPESVEALLKPCPVYIRIDSKDPLAKTVQSIVRDIQKEKHAESLRKLEELAGENIDLDKPPLLLFIGAYYHYLGEPEKAAAIFKKTAVEYPDSPLRDLALAAADKISSTLK